MDKDTYGSETLAETKVVKAPASGGVKQSVNNQSPALSNIPILLGFKTFPAPSVDVEKILENVNDPQEKDDVGDHLETVFGYSICYTTS